MERIIHRILVTWLLLLGGVLLAQHFGYVAPAYGLLVLVALTSPVVIAALFMRVVLSLRDAWRRVQALRRARKWKRRRAPDDGWLYDEGWRQ